MVAEECNMADTLPLVQHRSLVYSELHQLSTRFEDPSDSSGFKFGRTYFEETMIESGAAIKHALTQARGSVYSEDATVETIDAATQLLRSQVDDSPESAALNLVLYCSFGSLTVKDFLRDAECAAGRQFVQADQYQLAMDRAAKACEVDDDHFDGLVLMAELHARRQRWLDVVFTMQKAESKGYAPTAESDLRINTLQFLLRCVASEERADELKAALVAQGLTYDDVFALHTDEDLQDDLVSAAGFSLAEVNLLVRFLKQVHGGPGAAANSKFEAFYSRMGGSAALAGLDAVPISSLREAVSHIVGAEGAPSEISFSRGCDRAYAKADELLAPKPDEHGLNRDEIGAIFMYTQENLGGGGCSLYKPLNSALFSEGRGVVICYWGYLRLLQHALLKLPKCDAGALYRGLKGPLYAPISEDLMLAKATESGGSGEPEVWWGFSSCTTDLQATKNFLGPSGERVLYTVEGGSSARDVRRYSEFEKENEVLMPFGSAFTVSTTLNTGNGMLLVTLRQTDEFVYGAE